MYVQTLLVILALSIGICVGETATAPAPEPQTIGTYFYHDAASQTLKRLPKEEWKRHHGTGVSTITDNIKVEGAESSFRIPDNKPTFVFKVFKDEEAGKAKLSPSRRRVGDGNMSWQSGGAKTLRTTRA